VDLEKGDLVRWVIDYRVYEPVSNEAYPVEPLYAYGIIIKANNGKTITVACFKNCKQSWQVLHMIHDRFEILTRR